MERREFSLFSWSSCVSLGEISSDLRFMPSPDKRPGAGEVNEENEGEVFCDDVCIINFGEAKELLELLAAGEANVLEETLALFTGFGGGEEAIGLCKLA